uniref:Uncharacterized protein n=1 Tax=Avena sativa TaxID=4498 RepID=A0ACD6AAR0_AVESA
MAAAVVVDGRSNVAPDLANGLACSFTYRELLLATAFFNHANFLGEGGFGRVHKGTISITNAKGISEAQTVAVKQLAPEGKQGDTEFQVEVRMLTTLAHPNLVKLVGYCEQGNQRMLVYEYMPLRSLDNHLFDLPFGKQPLDWNTRVKIALGVAEGLSYLHNVADPPIIYRDMKAANILLDEDFIPKLSDFGLAKIGPVGDKTHISTRVMGTQGYCAPDYVESGRLTLKSDMYSLGVLLLELITGRKVYDDARPRPERYLMTWASPFMTDTNKVHMLTDPALMGRYPLTALNQLAWIINLCVHPKPHLRPIIADVVIALKHIASQPYVSERRPRPRASLPQCRPRAIQKSRRLYKGCAV